MSSIPFVAIGNNELVDAPELSSTIHCWRCGEHHPVEYGEQRLPDGRMVLSTTLAFMSCAGKTYLCGVNGKEWQPRKEADAAPVTGKDDDA